MNIGFGKYWLGGNVRTQLPALDSCCMHLQPSVYLYVQLIRAVLLLFWNPKSVRGEWAYLCSRKPDGDQYVNYCRALSLENYMSKKDTTYWRYMSVSEACRLGLSCCCKVGSGRSPNLPVSAILKSTCKSRYQMRKNPIEISHAEVTKTLGIPDGTQYSTLPAPIRKR